MLIGLAGLESPRALEALVGEPGEGSTDLSNLRAEDCGVMVSMFAGRRFSPDGDGVGLLDEGESSGPGDRWPPHCDMKERTAGRLRQSAQLQGRREAKQGLPFRGERRRHRRQEVHVVMMGGTFTYRASEA